MDVQGVAAAAVLQQTPPAAVPYAGTAQSEQFAAAPNGDALAPVIAKIFSQGHPAQPVTVDVRYRVEHDPNMIVMVFTDPHTGEEIAQVPSEMVVQMAQFFDKHSGVALDRNA